MKPLHAQILERALILSGIPVYNGRVKSEDIQKFMVKADEEIEVDFQHDGKNWIAVFNVLSYGYKPGGTEPETYDPGSSPDVELSGFYLKADPTANVDPPDLSDQKLEELADQAAEQVDQTQAAANFKSIAYMTKKQIAEIYPAMKVVIEKAIKKVIPELKYTISGQSAGNILIVRVKCSNWIDFMTMEEDYWDLGGNPFHYVKSHRKWDEMLDKVNSIAEKEFNRLVVEYKGGKAPITHITETGGSGSTLSLEFINQVGSDLYNING